MSDRLYSEGLRAANRGRALCGKKPVKRLKRGVTYDPWRCTIANTIGVPGCEVMPYTAKSSVGERVVLVVESGRYTIGGKLASRFAVAFDDGKYPELVQK